MNTQKFETLRKLSLPIGHYAITGSGPLGIRNLRQINDIDIIVSEALWGDLAIKYGIKEKNGFPFIVFPENDIEAMGKSSFPSHDKRFDFASISERIEQAEIIDRLPFESLNHVVQFKLAIGREKDLEDVRLIQEWLNKKDESIKIFFLTKI